MTRREHEPIPVEPARIPRVVPKVAGPQRERHRGCAKREAGMAGIRRLNRIDREDANAIDAELFKLWRRAIHGPESYLIGAAEAATWEPQQAPRVVWRPCVPWSASSP